MLKKFLYFLLLISIPFQSYALSEIEDTDPSPDLKPSDVVRIQLKAMQQNDPSNLGIEATFRFASPSNKNFTDPLSRFIRLVNHLVTDIF